MSVAWSEIFRGLTFSTKWYSGLSVKLLMFSIILVPTSLFWLTVHTLPTEPWITSQHLLQKINKNNQVCQMVIGSLKKNEGSLGDGA